MDYSTDEISIATRKAIRLWQILYSNLNAKFDAAGFPTQPHFGIAKLLANKDGTISISLGTQPKNSCHCSYDRLKYIDGKGRYHIFSTSDQTLIEYVKKCDEKNKQLHTTYLSIWPSSILSINDVLIRAKVFDLISTCFKNGFGWKSYRFYTIPGELEQAIIKHDIEVTQSELDLHNTIVETIICLERIKNPPPIPNLGLVW